MCIIEMQRTAKVDAEILSRMKPLRVGTIFIQLLLGESSISQTRWGHLAPPYNPLHVANSN